MSLKRTSCAYCGVGCGVLVSNNIDAGITTSSDTAVTDNHNAVTAANPHAFAQTKLTLKGDIQHPANAGDLCAKGERLLDSLHMPSRLLYPQRNAATSTHVTTELQWRDAITLIADTFTKTIAEYGPESVAFYLSGQLLTEDYYVANKLAKGFIGTPNVDTNSRLCMSSAVSAHIRAFGEDVVPGCYQDFELADVVVLVGANSAWTHPVLFKRLLAAKAARGTQIVVIDPMQTATAKQADLHLPLLPGTDAILFAGLLVHLADNDLLDNPFIAAHSEGFEAALVSARYIAPTLSATARLCGLTETQVTRFFSLYQPSVNTLTASCQGVNQSISGTDCTNAIINVHLALGQIGKQGAGFFSLTGQPNAMGGREVGGLATQLACHLGFSDAERRVVEDYWQAPNIVSRQGLSAIELFDAIDRGEVKAVWILGTNPVASLPGSAKIARALAACPFVVVSDISADTDTAQYADVLLPAQGWGEKSGTVTNSERCISRQRNFIDSKGQAKSDWWALCQVASAMGFLEFEFDSSAAIFREYAGLSAAVTQAFPDKSFSIAGLAQITDDEYETLPPTQWPVYHKSQIGQQHRRLFTDHQFATQSGRAQFVSTIAVAAANLHQRPDEQLMMLNSGRSRDQWHTMTRTGHIASLRATQAEPTVFLHPQTAERYGVEDAQFVRLAQPNQTDDDHFVIARAQFDENLPLNLLNMSMHWSQQFSQTGGVNLALDSRIDPISKQPGFKCQSVRIEPVIIPWQGIAFGRQKPQLTAPLWQVQQTLHQGECVYLGFSDEKSAYQGFDFPRCLSWRHGAHHILCAIEQGKLTALRIIAEQQVAVDVALMAELIGTPMMPALVKRLHQLLLAGNSPIICACTGVTSQVIATQVNAIAHKQVPENDLIDTVQQTLGCGRQCGSCNAEVQTEIRAQWLKRQCQSTTSPSEEVA